MYGPPGMAEDEVRIEHPNRKKASSKASKAVVILLLLVSAALVLIVTIGGWDALQGAKLLQIAYILVYLLMAFYVARWNRGITCAISMRPFFICWAWIRIVCGFCITAGTRS